MKDFSSNIYLKKFLDKTNCKSILLATDSGLCISSEFANNDKQDIDKITSILSVLVSLGHKISEELFGADAKKVIIKNEKDYIIIKPFSDTLFLLVQVEKSVDLDSICNEMELTTKAIMKTMDVSGLM